MTAMIWLLMVIVNGQTMQSATYPTQEACQAAGVVAQANPQVSAFHCIPRGKH